MVLLKEESIMYLKLSKNNYKNENRKRKKKPLAILTVKITQVTHSNYIKKQAK
jgi:hypothetical protein